MVFGLKLGLPKKAPAEPPSSEPVASKGGANGGKSALTVNEFVARTKRCREKGLEPTKPELIAYARYLGIDPITDGDLMWVADEALNAPLPSEWTEHHDSADRVFYYNVQTHASSWTHPLEQVHRQTYKNIVKFRSGALSKEERSQELEKMRRDCETAEREAHRELQAWSEHTDEQGQKFYYNRERQNSVWTDPRPAQCHVLYLQMKALRVLSKQLGQSAPAPRRDLEPLGLRPSADNRGTSDSEHESLFPSQSRSKKDGGLRSLDDNEGSTSYDDDLGGADNRKRNKRKKRDRDAEAGAKGPPQLGGLTPMSPGHSQLESPKTKGGHGGLPDAGLGLGGGLGGGLLNLKKPALADVEEVRKAVGLGDAATRLPPMGAMGHSNLFGNAGGRLPSPQTDGLSTVGRAKVRAGIRLDPL
jgi:hypothetical protein